MQVSDLNEHQRALLNEAIQQAMISAAGYFMANRDVQRSAASYVEAHPDCSLADAMNYALGDFAGNHLTYRPFEFNEFLASLEA